MLVTCYDHFLRFLLLFDANFSRSLNCVSYSIGIMNNLTLARCGSVALFSHRKSSAGLVGHADADVTFLVCFTLPKKSVCGTRASIVRVTFNGKAARCMEKNETNSLKKS